jgi:hypothetical protein
MQERLNQFGANPIAKPEPFRSPLYTGQPA